MAEEPKAVPCSSVLVVGVLAVTQKQNADSSTVKIIALR